jgi:hypothetical protein
VDLWEWCAEYVRAVRASGDQERAELFGYFERSFPLWETRPDDAGHLLGEGRALARRLGEPCWQLVYDHWLVELAAAQARWREAMDIVVPSAVEARKQTYDDCPARILVQGNLVTCYIGADPMLYENQIREAIDYIGSQAGGDPQVDAANRSALLWLELSLDRQDAAEEAGLRLIARDSSDPNRTIGGWTLLCEVAYRRGDWRTLAGWAGEGERTARSLGARRVLAEFLAWRAVTARAAGDHRTGRRLYRQAESKINRLDVGGALYTHAVTAYLEVDGELEKALDIRRQGVDWSDGHPAEHSPPWQASNVRIRYLQLLAHMGLPLEPALSRARGAADRMGVPAFMHAKLDRIERDVAEGRPGPPYSWQRGENYVDY